MAYSRADVENFVGTEVAAMSAQVSSQNTHLEDVSWLVVVDGEDRDVQSDDPNDALALDLRSMLAGATGKINRAQVELVLQKHGRREVRR